MLWVSCTPQHEDEPQVSTYMSCSLLASQYVPGLKAINHPGMLFRRQADMIMELIKGYMCIKLDLRLITLDFSAPAPAWLDPEGHGGAFRN